MMVHINVREPPGDHSSTQQAVAYLQEGSMGTGLPQQCVAACSSQPSLFCLSPKPSLCSYCLVQSAPQFYEDGLCPIGAHLS